MIVTEFVIHLIKYAIYHGHYYIFNYSYTILTHIEVVRQLTDNGHNAVNVSSTQ